MQAVQFYNIDFFFNFIAASYCLPGQYREIVFFLYSICNIVIASGVKNIIVGMISYPNLDDNFIIAGAKRNFKLKVFVL